MIQAPDSFQVPSSYSRIIARMLELQERELPDLLAGTGLPTHILQPGDETFISGAQQIQVLENGHRLMRGAGFGLALGRQLGPSSHGPVGYLSLASPNLVGALTAYGNFIPARLPFVSLEVTLTEDWLECSYRILLQTPEAIAQSMAESFALSVQLVVEAILRREAREAQLGFRHSRPDHANRYRDFLHGRVAFNCDRVYYRLPAALAHVPNSAGDTESFRLTRELCNRLLRQQPRLERSVEDRVRTLLLTQPQGAVNEELVAKAMFVSRRTLARRLAQEGTGYRRIRDDVLYELASQSLLEPGRSVESIAASLGYHDSAAFRKAFRRWSGQTPGAWRAASQSPSMQQGYQ